MSKKLIFLKKIIGEIKNKKLSILSNDVENLNKEDPYNERQTVDVDIDIEYKANKKKSQKTPTKTAPFLYEFPYVVSGSKTTQNIRKFMQMRVLFLLAFFVILLALFWRGGEGRR